MPTRLARETFLQYLQAVQPGLAPREIIEQSTCVVLRGGKAGTFNDEVSCRGPSGLDKTLTGAVKLQPVIDLLGKLQMDEIEVDATDSKLVIVGAGKSRNEGCDFLLEKEITLPIASVEKPGDWMPLPGEFCDAIALVGQAASQERNSEYDTDCVHIAPKWIECTDRIQLCRWAMKTKFPESVYVRQSSVAHAARLGVTEFSVGASWLHFKNPGGVTLSCRRYLDVKYPDLGPFLKVEGTVVQLPTGLPEACEKAQVFSKTSDLDRVMVEIGRGRMTLSGHGPQGRYWRRFKIAWTGESLAFLTSPDILKELVSKHKDFTLAPKRLAVSGGHFNYVVCTSEVPDEMKNGKAGNSNDR